MLNDKSAIFSETNVLPTHQELNKQQVERRYRTLVPYRCPNVQLSSLLLHVSLPVEHTPGSLRRGTQDREVHFIPAHGIAFGTTRKTDRRNAFLISATNNIAEKPGL